MKRSVHPALLALLWLVVLFALHFAPLPSVAPLLLGWLAGVAWAHAALRALHGLGDADAPPPVDALPLLSLWGLLTRPLAPLARRFGPRVGRSASLGAATRSLSAVLGRDPARVAVAAVVGVAVALPVARYWVHGAFGLWLLVIAQPALARLGRPLPRSLGWLLAGLCVGLTLLAGAGVLALSLGWGTQPDLPF